MNTPARNFREWMDDNEVTIKEACKRFGISKQTLYNWRSQGVPNTRQNHVNYIISCWGNPAAAQIGLIPLRPSPEQFRRWNQAALDDGLLIEDWAIAGLDEYAGTLGIESILKVAEDPPPYGEQMGNG